MKKVRMSAILATTLGLLSSVNAAERGTAIFDGFCNRCHGTQGEGIKNLGAPLIAGMSAWYVEGQLHKFREGIRGTHPKDVPGMRMRPMASTLKDFDVPTIAAYVAKLPVQPPAPGLEDADLKKGEVGFAMCMGCHGPNAQGNQQMKAPALAGQDGWYLLTQLKNFKTGIRGSNPRDDSGAIMRGMVGTLNDEAMKNVAAYLQSLFKK